VLILEWVLFIGTQLAWSSIPSSWLRFRRRFSLLRKSIFSFCLKRWFWGALRWFLFSWLFFLFSFDSRESSACSPCCTSYFQVRHSTTPIWARSVVCKLWWQVSTNVDYIMPLRHQSAILWNLSINIFIGSLFFCFVARRVGIDIFVSSSKKWARNSFSKLAHFMIEPTSLSWTI